MIRDGRQKPPIWVDFLNDAAGREAMKPFIAAASAFSKEAGVVSGIAGAGAFLDMHGSALSALDGGCRKPKKKRLRSTAMKSPRHCAR